MNTIMGTWLGEETVAIIGVYCLGNNEERPGLSEGGLPGRWLMENDLIREIRGPPFPNSL